MHSHVPLVASLLVLPHLQTANRASHLQLIHKVQLLQSSYCVLLLPSQYSNATHAMSCQAKQSGARDKPTGVAYIASKFPILKNNYELIEPVTGSFVKVQLCRANWISWMSFRLTSVHRQKRTFVACVAHFWISIQAVLTEFVTTALFLYLCTGAICFGTH